MNEDLIFQGNPNSINIEKEMDVNEKSNRFESIREFSSKLRGLQIHRNFLFFVQTSRNENEILFTKINQAFIEWTIVHHQQWILIIIEKKTPSDLIN